ncbi:MAG TPA: hypothetical protein VGB67_04295, partial [Fibrella sp.]
MRLPFTSNSNRRTPGFSPSSTIRRSPQRQRATGLSSFIHAVCILVLLGLTLTALRGQAQCPTGDVFLFSQAQVDAFPAGCSTVPGILIIRGADITDLSPFASLTSVGRRLSIEYNPELTSLSGLEKLTSVGTSVDDYLLINNNAKLTSIAGLSSLASVAGALSIQNNPLTSLSGLEKLTSSGSLAIARNAKLTSIAALSSLVSVAGQVRIQNTPELTSLSGLEKLTSFGSGGILLITNNAKLTSIAGLSSLASVEGVVEIRDNPVLTSLNGLQNLTSVGGNLRIINNAGLTTCAIASVCRFLATPPPGGITISGNATGCASVAEVQAICNPTNNAPVLTDQPDNTTICAGSKASFSVTASNATTYQWQVNQGSGFIDLSNTGPYSGVTTATLTLTGAPAALTGYQYRVVVSGGGSNATTSDAVTLTVAPLPAPAINPSSATLTCASPSVNLMASGGGTYRWNDNSTAAMRTVSSAGTYSVTVTSATGCTATASATISENKVLPAPSLLTASGQAYPAGQSSVQVDLNSGTVTLLASGCSGTIHWSGPNNTAGTGTTIQVPTTQPGTLVYGASCQLNGCVSPLASASVSVGVRLQVQHRDVDNYANNNAVQPVLQLINQGSGPLSLSALTL